MAQSGSGRGGGGAESLAAAHAGELAGLRPNGGPELGLAQFWAWESKGAGF